MIPQRIEIKGFQSHAHTILDLSNIDYAMVVGNNGAGKSTIFGAMLFGLFGDAYTRDTGANMSEFFRHGAAELSVDFQFALGDQRYRVARRRTPSGKGTLALDVYTGEKWQAMTGTDVKDTEDKIAKLLGMDYRTLTASCFIRQGKAGAFAELTSSERIEVLARILGLDVYEQCAVKCRKAASDAQSDLKPLRNMLDALRQAVGERASVEAELAEKTQGIEAETANLENARRNLSAAQEEARLLEGDRVKLEGREADKTRIEGEILDLATKIGNAISRRGVLVLRLADKDALAEKVAQLPEAEETLAEFEKEFKRQQDLTIELSSERAAGNKLQGDRQLAETEARNAYMNLQQRLKGELTNLEREKKVLADTIGLKDGAKCDDEDKKSCPFIGHVRAAEGAVPQIEDRIAHVTKQIEELETTDEFAAYKKAHEEAKAENAHFQRAAEIESELDAMTYDGQAHLAQTRKVDELREAKDALGKLAADEKEYETIGAAIEEAEKTKADRESTLSTVEADIAALANVRERAGTNRQTVEQWTSAAHRFEEFISTHERLKAQIEARLAQIGEKEEEARRVASEIERLEQVAERNAELGELFSKRGLQAMCIEDHLPEIAETANSILSKVSENLSVDFPTDKLVGTGSKVRVRETLDIQITDELGERSYNLLSGGEQFRVNFALRVALSLVVAHRAGTRLETLIIDEGFGSQDDSGIERLTECLHAIRDWFKCILVVSHRKEMGDAFPTQIRVEKTSAGSVVTVL